MKRIFTPLLILISMIWFGQNPVIEDLWSLYNAHNYKSAIEKAKPLLENDPNSLDLNLILGRSYTEEKDYDTAVPYLEFAVKNDHTNSWRKPWALAYLGTCYFMQQKYDDAEKSIKASLTLKATKNAAANAYYRSVNFGFHAFYQNWKTVETDNFRFHFQRMSETEIENFILPRVAAYKTINDFFKSTLPKKIDVFVWGSREDAREILKARLGFSLPEFCVVHTYYDQTVGHEITHVISNYTSDISFKTAFINEGTAVCFDQTDQDRLKQVKDWVAANNKHIAIMDYWKNRTEDEILYPLAGLFVEKLIDTFGKEKFLAFFSDQTYENAKAIFGDGLDRVIEELENKINL